MQFENETDTTKMLAKIRNLLAKAESTEFPEEAEAFTAKAQALMSSYSIDEALLRRDAVKSGTIKPNTRQVHLDKPYVKHKAHLISYIADANNCSVVWNAYIGQATLFGFDADLDLVEMLYTSLLVQAEVVMSAAGQQVSEWGESSTRSYRSAFLYAFGMRIGQRLKETYKRAVEAAGTGAEVALVSQIEVVKQAAAEAFPNARSSRVSVSNSQGWADGAEAANGADIGRRRQIKAS